MKKIQQNSMHKMVREEPNLILEDEKAKQSSSPQEKRLGKTRRAKDNASKMVFGNEQICAQFLKDYIPIDEIKKIRPEDIEDVSERFISMWDEQRDSDTVKRIRLSGGTSLFFIGIIEHQSQVDFTMSIKLLRYMVMIWTDYELEMEQAVKGITKRKDFKYPPVLPIVYFEGTSEWTAVKNFKDRVALADIFHKYIPSYEYEVIRLHDYSDAQLIEKQNELSLIMLVKKLRGAHDFAGLQSIPKDYLEKLEKNSPEDLLKLISCVVAGLLRRLNIPDEEISTFTEQIRKKEIGMMFDSFKGYDVPETRRISKAEGKAEAILEILEVHGEVGDKLRQRIMSETDLDTLKKWLMLSLQCKSIENFAKEAEIMEDKIC